MFIETLLIAGITIIALAVFAYVVRRWILEAGEKQKPSEEIIAWLKAQSESSNKNLKQFTDTLSSSTKAINEALSRQSKQLLDAQRHIYTKLQESSKAIGQMSEIGRGMKELQQFLQSPKLRGNIGEHVLRELLGQMLPKQSFHLQYTFKNGTIVDAVIQTASGLIPIDSKFPMENFKKLSIAETEKEKQSAKREFANDVRKHVRSIASKYILTEEGTIDYALMYIPSEAVYYEIVNNSELFDYAGKERILPVSPVTFYAYLKAILMSFEGQKIEAQAKQILAHLRALQKDYEKTDQNLSVLGRHLNNAYNMMNNVVLAFSQLGQRLSSIQVLSNEGEKKLASQTDKETEEAG